MLRVPDGEANIPVPTNTFSKAVVGASPSRVHPQARRPVPTQYDLLCFAALLLFGSSKDAGYTLGISLFTVQNATCRFRAKLGAADNYEAARMLGWLTVPEELLAELRKRAESFRRRAEMLDARTPATPAPVESDGLSRHGSVRSLGVAGAPSHVVRRVAGDVGTSGGRTRT